MLFSTIYAFALLALSTVVLGGKEHCVVTPSCLGLPTQTAVTCSSLISRSALSRPVCISCSATTRPVVTTRLTTVKTATISTTKTIWVTKPTVGVITKTNVVTRTITSTVTSTTWRTASVPATRATTRLPSQTCLARRALDPRQVASVFPKICSCFLTTTRTTGTYTILLTSFLLPNATSNVQITSTKTTTSTRFTTTKTSQVVTLRTTTRTAYSTLWRTATTFVSTKPTPSTFEAACAAPLGVSDQPITGNLRKVPAVKAKNFAECCNLCFASEGCNSYEFEAASQNCVLRYSKASTQGCETDYCQFGKQIFNTGDKAPGKVWGHGPCYLSTRPRPSAAP